MALIDAIEAARHPHRPVSIYGEPARVWDFVIARRYDYDALAAFLDECVPDNARTGPSEARRSKGTMRPS